tara:strand:+ start:863 stop:1687 length:825 start_codon:yes stop_codon:yes gene_type:complete
MKNNMKNSIIFLTLLMGLQVVSQNINRVEIKGRIIVESSDLIGITVLNTTTNVGTITNEMGEFVLSVGLNDFIEVSALQFEDIGIKVNQDMINSKTMKIFLIEEIFKLDEIVVSKKGLSGNLNADIKTTNTFTPKLDALYFAIQRSDDYELKDDYKSEVTNEPLIVKEQKMVNGLNVVNVVNQLLVPLFRSRIKDKEALGIPEVPVELIKQYFCACFITDNFNIPEHRVEEFIRYVESSENFDYSLLNYGNEMEFLEFLHTKSLQFLNKDNKPK